MPYDAPPVDQTPPAFVTMDRFDSESRAGLELQYLFVKGDSDTKVYGFQAHGQYVDKNSGFGGYLQLPFAFITGGNDSDNVVGNLEVGATYMPKLAVPGFDLVLRGGITLPTGSNEIGLLIGEFTNINNFVNYIPRGTTLRLGVSPIVHQGQFFARADVGIDARLDDGDAVGGDTFTIVRLNAGVGIDFGGAAAMLEFVNLHASSNGSGSWVDQGALSFRLHGPIQPYASVILPFNSDIKDSINAALVVGVDGRL